MSEPLTERTVVIGNSGSGKSTLAEAIAHLADIPAIDLDLLHWEEGGYGAKRDEDVARKARRKRVGPRRPQGRGSAKKVCLEKVCHLGN